MDWMRPTPTREGTLLCSVYRFPCSSYPETASQAHPEYSLTRGLAPATVKWANEVDHHGFFCPNAEDMALEVPVDPAPAGAH